MRILFMGTPQIAASCLSALAASHHTVVAAVTMPDKPVGRRMVMTPPPLKVRAEELGIPVYQPGTLRDEALLPLLREVKPDVCVVVAFGRILPKYVLEFPPYGCLNLHVSLLPQYRGAAPMQRAIMAGERETGVSVMYMDEGLDTGDILSVHPFPIGPCDDLGAVEARSAEIGGEALVRALDLLAAGTAPRIPQPAEGATYAAKITKEDTYLDFAAPAAAILARVRALSPAPLAVCRKEDGRLFKVVTAVAGEGSDAYGVYPEGAVPPAPTGTVVALSDKGEGAITVACLDGTVVFTRVHPAGKSVMSAADFVRGRGVALGERLL